MSEGEPSAAERPDGQRSVGGSLDGPWKTRGGGRSSRALRAGFVSAVLVVEPRRRGPCVRVDRGSDARPFGRTRAAGWRFVPLVRRSVRRAGLDPQRRSGSGTDPPVFYGGKAGKSLTAIPIMASFARDWKLPTEFARGGVASMQRSSGRQRRAARCQPPRGRPCRCRTFRARRSGTTRRRAREGRHGTETRSDSPQP